MNDDPLGLDPLGLDDPLQLDNKDRAALEKLNNKTGAFITNSLENVKKDLNKGTLSGALSSGTKGTVAGIADIIAGIPKIGAQSLLAIGGKLAEPSRSLQNTWETAGAAINETYPPFSQSTNPASHALMYPFEKYGQGVEWVAEKAGKVAGPDVQGAVNITGNFAPIPFIRPVGKVTSNIIGNLDPGLKNIGVKKPFKEIPQQQTLETPHKTYVEDIPQETRDLQSFYNKLDDPLKLDEPINRGDLSTQEGLPFTDSVEKVREAQVADSPQRDMFVEENQLQRKFDPYQEQLQKQADMDRLDLQKMAEEGAKQEELDAAFTQRQRMLFEEEQARKVDEQTNRLEDIEQRLRENKSIPRSELGAIDVKAVMDGIRNFQEGNSTARDVFNAFRGAFTDREMDQALWHANDPRSKDTIALMSPAQFHSLAAGRTPSEINQWADRLHPPIREGLASKGGLWDIPFLRVEKDGQVSAHEGRHRMDVFKEMGVPLVPVRLHGLRWGSEAIPERLYPQDSKLVSPELKMAFSQPMPQILTQRKTLNPQAGVIDLNALKEGLQKLRILGKDSPELAPAIKDVQDDGKREAVYNSIPGLDPFRPTYNTPEKVLASLDKKDLSDTQLKTAKTVKPGIRTVRVANNNPLIAFGQEKISKMVTEADKDARDFITSKDGVGPVWEKLQENEKIELHRVLKAGDAEQRRFTPEELAEAGYSKNQIEFVEKFYKMEDYELDLWNEQRLAIGMEPVKARPGHFRSVFKGDFWSLAMEEGPDGKPRIVGFVGTDTKMGYNKVIEDLKAKTPTLTFTPMKRRGLSGSYRRSDLAQGMSEIMEWLGKNDPRMEQIRQAVQQITVQNADAWMGADLHALNKKGIWGNEGNKPWGKDEAKAANEAMKAYLTSWEEAVLSHRNLGVNAELTGLMQNPEVQAKWPNAVEYMNKYTKHMTGTYTSQLAATLNNAIDLTTKAVSFGQLGPSAPRAGINQFTKRMGQWTQGFGNMVYTGMQWLQLFATAMPEFMRVDNPIQVGDSLQVGFRDALTYFKYKNMNDVNISDFQKDMFKYAEDRGLLTFSEFDDVSKVTQNKTSRAFDKIVDYNRSNLGETPTRPFVFFVFADLLRKQENLPDSELFDTAYNLTQYSMTDYHPSERPLMYKDLGVAGQLAGSLQQYKHSYVNQMVQWGKDVGKHPATAIAGLTAALTLSGYRGLPGYDDADAIVKWLTNKFGDKQTSIAQIVASNAPEWLSYEAPSFGLLSSETGINFSSRLGMAQLSPESPIEALSPYAGKAARLGEHAYETLRGANPKALQNLGMELAPSSIRGLLEDQYSTSESGMLENKKGQNEYQRSEFDRSVRRFGLQSLEEYKARDKVYQGQSNQRKDQERRGAITEESVMKFNQLGKEWLKSPEFKELQREYQTRGGDPEQLINSIIQGKIDAGLTGKQRAEGTNPSSIGAVRRYQYQNP